MCWYQSIYKRESGGSRSRTDRSPDLKSIIQFLFLFKRSLTIMQHTNKWITLVFLSFLCTAQAALDTRTNPPAKKTPPPPPKAKKAPPAPARPLAPEADPTKPNRLQYHQHLMGTQTIGSTEHEHICEIGFAYPTGLKVGDTLIIKGRTDLKTGTEESTTFFNRASGHKVRETVAALLYNLFCSLLADFIGSVLPTFVTWHIIHILICIVNPGCVLFVVVFQRYCLWTITNTTMMVTVAEYGSKVTQQQQNTVLVELKTNILLMVLMVRANETITAQFYFRQREQRADEG